MPKSHHTRLWALLLASLAVMMPVAASGITFPSTFEVDLLFPRNETYAPQALMPVLFAMQNPALVVTMGGYAIAWALARNNNYSVPGAFPNDLFAEDGDPRTALNQPYYFIRGINTLDYPDSSWTLSWNIIPNNCTVAEARYDPYDNDRQYHGSVTFTTKKGAQVPDLVAATAPGVCKSATGFAFEVKSVTLDQCGSIAPWVSGSANPCAASLNATGASSIIAAITASACSLLQPTLNPNVTCFTSRSSADRSMASAYTWALLVVLVVMLNLVC